MNGESISWMKEFYGWKPVTEKFTIGQYVNINNNIQFLKYDPTLKLVKDDPALNDNPSNNIAPIYKAENITFLGDNYLYEYHEPSNIRPYPMRFFYNHTTGRAYELNGDSKNLYELMRYLYATAYAGKAESKIKEKVQEWVNENMLKYARLFFDNVKGSYGRFEFVYTYEDLEDRIKSYYRYISNYENTSTGSDLPEAGQEKFLALLKEKLEAEALVRREPVYNPAEKAYEIKEQFMIFQKSLFSATIGINVSKDNFGAVYMADEIMWGYENGQLLKGGGHEHIPDIP